VIAFSPLAQGLLTSKYLEGIPDESRAAKIWTDEQRRALGGATRQKIARLNEIAVGRGQTLAQMAIAWILRCPEVTSVLIGASSTDQIEENVRALDNPKFTAEEFQRIDDVLNVVERA
jgi:L-glyceraldehyde 3-phosphate reductase